MKRREFLAASTALGLAPWGVAQGDDQQGSGREYLELRQYQIETPEQRDAFETFAREAAIAALNRAGIKPVGVFLPLEDLSPVYVLLPHKTLSSVTSLMDKLSSDTEFAIAGAEFINATREKPAYTRLESSLMLAFQGMPHVETPITSPDRIFQLRIYESPSEITGQKKIEMFNDAGEISIFRRVGLHPVFFGETLIGGKMPNLTYMLSFDNEEELKTNWGKFGADPDWQRLRKMGEYADTAILSKITNLLLKPAACSQI